MDSSDTNMGALDNMKATRKVSIATESLLVNAKFAYQGHFLLLSIMGFHSPTRNLSATGRCQAVDAWDVASCPVLA